jgi:antitoxin component YwqK of YwqJK toxin-antitoxin module
LRQGIFKSYHENGQLWNEVNFINGTKNGIYKLYHINGQLEDEVNYIDGKKVKIKKNNKCVISNLNMLCNKFLFII